MRILLPEMPGSTTMVSPLVLPSSEDIRKTLIGSMTCQTRFRPSFGHAVRLMISDCRRSLCLRSTEISRRHGGVTAAAAQSDDRIFVAIQMSSAENEHRLLQYEEIRDQGRRFLHEKGMRDGAG